MLGSLGGVEAWGTVGTPLSSFRAAPVIQFMEVSQHAVLSHKLELLMGPTAFDFTFKSWTSRGFQLLRGLQMPTNRLKSSCCSSSSSSLLCSELLRRRTVLRSLELGVLPEPGPRRAAGSHRASGRSISRRAGEGFGIFGVWCVLLMAILGPGHQALLFGEAEEVLKAAMVSDDAATLRLAITDAKQHKVNPEARGMRPTAAAHLHPKWRRSSTQHTKPSWPLSLDVMFA